MEWKRRHLQAQKRYQERKKIKIQQMQANMKMDEIDLFNPQ